MRDMRERMKGSIPALITPFKNGEVDEAAFRRLVSWQIAEGSHGLVPAGTTGESATLSHDEHRRVVEICVDEARGPRARHRRRRLELDGRGHRAHADMPRKWAPTPCFRSRPITTGRRRKGSIAISRRLPMPSTSPIVDLQHSRPAARWRFPSRRWRGISRVANIAGVKDATANLGAPEPRACSPARRVSGCSRAKTSRRSAIWRMAAWLHLCDGQCSRRGYAPNSRKPAWQGDYARALELQDRLAPLHDAMFCEASPAPVKFASVSSGPVLGRGPPADRGRDRAGARPCPAMRWRPPA